ncbi:hypothetical protein VTN96DRAFT_9172 [Rasamsonia emersonii]|uniref:Methyltransferase type 11 domain-containing protein n=1 Tax=Rasamsonia emersonii (strain ATCC 16479 / CBS 393.64 / IMI 116815) TaxID=1408163 RepID=A0A0F4YIS1_RASE3|nr:hypothetical protein T310_7883 [Rasamsonia emersonii CBS 393.64]KKA18167.1 hypothetical protein T310_7883 [Rasamsonia emersonii CBS 393.64]
MTQNRLGTAISSPPRRARRTVLNTIIEDTREAQYGEDDGSHSRLTVTTNPAVHQGKVAMAASKEEVDRVSTPVSTDSLSSCSDQEWQRGMRSFDELYDATDDESGEECPSLSSSRPSSLATTSVRGSTYSSNSRNRYPSLTIPSDTLWPSLNTPNKSSPVPPTPPPKIPVSPAALSRLPRFVPALHAPPSLDGSVSSDQISNMSAPPTPELQAVSDLEWDDQPIRVLPDSEATRNADESSTGMVTEGELAIEAADDNWNPLLESFPRIPVRGEEETTETIPIVFADDSARSQSPEADADGIMLPPDAMATLQHIPLDGTPEPWSETSEKNDEMQQLSAPPSRPRSADGATPSSELSGYSFTNLSIPSPGDFFSSLAPRARRTWAIPDANNPPSSAVAERFYNVPWNRDEGEIVEQVVQCPEHVCADEQPTAVPLSSGPPTAIRISSDPENGQSHQNDSPISSGTDPVQEIDRSGVTYEYDESYEEELKRQAVANLDRTSVWLAAQASYLAALRETNPANKAQPNAESPEAEKVISPSVADSLPRKSVRFAENALESAASSPPPQAPASKDSIYWRGFQSVLQRSRRRDTFLHSNIRFDAVQSVRLALRDKHVDSLMGKYELVRPERPAYTGPFSQAPRNSKAAEVLAEQAFFAELEKEQMVLAQLRQSMWATEALRYLNGGSLISSPASRRLSKVTQPLNSREKAGKRRLRVLDLGGQAACGWAWHLANDYRNVKIYTVVTKDQVVNDAIKGPPNHRCVSVSCLWKLPFRDNQFDVISARSLHALLKTERPIGESLDEFDLCLQECYRCLKPGGYLEFFVMDAEIARAGPYGSATSVEFAFNLKTRGYDPAPTKRFLARMRRSRFVGIKRAWLFLPMGVEPVKSHPPRETPDPTVPSQVPNYEAVHGPVGSTADVASMTGLLGGWMWEQWMLKLQMEMGRERKKLLEGVGSIFDEGRKNGSGWTCLCGWAMKPKRRPAKHSAVNETAKS